MATAPTFASYVQVANWQVKATTAKTVVASWSAGDYVYVCGAIADGGTTFTGVPTATGLTFTQIAFWNGTGSPGFSPCAYVWVALASGAGSGVTISSSTLSNATNCAGISALVVSGSDGTGNVVVHTAGNTSRSISLTRSADNSGVLYVAGDWSAETPAPTAWTPATNLTARTDTSDGANYGVHIATWGDQGTAGATAYGQSGAATPADGWGKVAVEILGAAGGGSAVVPGRAQVVNAAALQRATF